MRTRLAAAFAVIALLASPSPRALADDGTPWRVTSPRVRLETAERRLELVIPAGRARGATSRAIPIEPGETYVGPVRRSCGSWRDRTVTAPSSRRQTRC